MVMQQVLITVLTAAAFTLISKFASRISTSLCVMFGRSYGFITAGNLKILDSSTGFYWVAGERVQGTGTWTTDHARPTSPPGTAV
jgi:hypothetical protein